MNIFKNPVLRGDIEARDYQVRIASNILYKNSLVILPTGLGKTIISILVASQYLYKYGDKAILIMAPTKPLIQQHLISFVKHLKIHPDRYALITGELKPELRSYIWMKDGIKIFFATPETVRNDLKYVPLEKIILAIFDECHRAVKNYAYVRVADEYLRRCRYPHILGLTATPGDEKRLREIIKNLAIERIEARDEEDPDVKPYVKPVKIIWRTIFLPKEYYKAIELIKGMINDRISRLKGMGYLRKPDEYIVRRDLVRIAEWLGEEIEATMLDEERYELLKPLIIDAQALILYHMLEVLTSQGSRQLRLFMDRLESDLRRSRIEITSDPRYLTLVRLMNKLPDHPKVDEVVREVVKYRRSLVFTNFTDTARHLAGRLRDRGVNAEIFIGRGGGRGMSQRLQRETLERFRSGVINCLVATSIGEEGIDIPDVDLVIFYEPVPSAIRFIQRRGRTGRTRFGRVLILAAKGSFDMNYMRSAEKRLGKLKEAIGRANKELIGRKLGRDLPQASPMSDEEIRAGEAVKPEEAITELLGERSRIIRRRFDKELREATQYIIREISSKGKIDLSEVEEELKAIGISESAVKNAFSKLLEEEEIKIAGPKIYSKGKAEETLKRGETRLIEIVKIDYRSGKAIVNVDDKWHAIVWLPAEWSAPKHLLKRGRYFKAITKLYHVNGKLHARIYDVIEEL